MVRPARGPSGLFELDGVWHWVGTALPRYMPPQTTYWSLCGGTGPVVMPWGPDERRRTYGMTMEPEKRPRPEPECRDCRLAYAAALRRAADEVEAGA